MLRKEREKERFLLFWRSAMRGQFAASRLDGAWKQWLERSEGKSWSTQWKFYTKIGNSTSEILYFAWNFKGGIFDLVFYCGVSGSNIHAASDGGILRMTYLYTPNSVSHSLINLAKGIPGILACSAPQPLHRHLLSRSGRNMSHLFARFRFCKQANIVLATLYIFLRLRLQPILH